MPVTWARSLVSASMLACVAFPSGAAEPPVSFAPAEEAEIFHIRIIDLTRVHDFRAAVQGTTPKVLASRHVAASPQAHRLLLGGMLRHKDATKATAVAAAERWASGTGPRVRWANVSPSGTHALVGYENPLADPIHTAAVLEASNSSWVWRLKVGDVAADSLWTKDSRTVLLVETTERWLKSPRGLLRLLLGHPVPLSNVYLTACSLESRTCERVEIARDLEFATMRLERADGAPSWSEP